MMPHELALELEHEHDAESKRSDTGPVAYTYVLNVDAKIPEITLVSGGTVTFEATRPLTEELLQVLDRRMEELGYRRD